MSRKDSYLDLDDDDFRACGRDEILGSKRGFSLILTVRACCGEEDARLAVQPDLPQFELVQLWQLERFSGSGFCRLWLAALQWQLVQVLLPRPELVYYR